MHPSATHNSLLKKNNSEFMVLMNLLSFDLLKKKTNQNTAPVQKMGFTGQWIMWKEQKEE